MGHGQGGTQRRRYIGKLVRTKDALQPPPKCCYLRARHKAVHTESGAHRGRCTHRVCIQRNSLVISGEVQELASASSEARRATVTGAYGGVWGGGYAGEVWGGVRGRYKGEVRRGMGVVRAGDTRGLGGSVREGR